jgi:hypothetical protein
MTVAINKTVQPAEPGEYLRLSQVADILPRNDDGSKISQRSIERWIFNGQKGIKLKARKIGRNWLVTREDLAAFGEQVAARSLGASLPAAKNLATRKMSASTRKFLIANGLLKPTAALEGAAQS